MSKGCNTVISLLIIVLFCANNIDNIEVENLETRCNAGYSGSLAVLCNDGNMRYL